MDMLTTSAIMGALVVIGYLLGNGQSGRMLSALADQQKIYRDTMDKHYKDVIVLLNQYSSLSAQLFNQSKNVIGPSPEFPSPESFQESEEEPEPEPDLSGGRI